VIGITFRSLYPREKSGIPFAEGWVGFGAGLDGKESLAPTGILSLDRLARSDVINVYRQ
jgi:hypothetical protein